MQRLTLASLLLLAGCGAFDEFDVTISDSASVPGNFQAMVFQPSYSGSFGSLDLSGEQTFKNNNVKPSDVDAIYVKSIRLEDSQPMLNNLANIVESVSFTLEAPGQAPRQIGVGMAFPMAASAELMVDPTYNIKDYATAAAMSIKAEVKLKKSPAFSFTIKSTITLHVDINLAGV